MRGGGIIGVIVLVWLLIGVVAAYQRDYFKTAVNNCGTAATIAVTVRSGSAELHQREPQGELLSAGHAPTRSVSTWASTKEGYHDCTRSDSGDPGLVFGVPIMTYIGVVALVIGAVFWALGRAGHAVGGRRVWY